MRSFVCLADINGGACSGHPHIALVSADQSLHLPKGWIDKAKALVGQIDIEYTVTTCHPLEALSSQTVCASGALRQKTAWLLDEAAFITWSKGISLEPSTKCWTRTASKHPGSSSEMEFDETAQLWEGLWEVAWSLKSFSSERSMCPL